MFVRSLSLGVAAVALLSSTAMAADLFIPTTPEPIYEAAGFSWEGLYAGVTIGKYAVNDGEEGIDSDNLALSLGGVVGVNFIPADPILVGLELQGDYLYSGEDNDAGMFLALARVGAIVTDNVLVYATGGFGLQSALEDDVDSEGVFALGAGIEVAVTDNVTVRGEVLGVGYLDEDLGDDFFDAGKATVGVFYHF